MMRFKDRVVLITGSSRGIGRATALAFGSEGAKVVVNYRGNEEAAQEVASEIGDRGGKAVCIRADISCEEDVNRLFDEVVNHWGTVDVLVNNAGAHNPKPFDDLTWSDWEKVLHTNVIGTFMCCRRAAWIMREHKAGKIVNVASVRGLFYCGREGNIDYSASKSGVLSLTTTLAKELGPNIKVNAVAPGPTETDLMSSWSEDEVSYAINESYLKRLIQPDEVARAILFLASSDSDAITGEVLVVDGGYSLK